MEEKKEVKEKVSEQVEVVPVITDTAPGIKVPGIEQPISEIEALAKIMNDLIEIKKAVC